MPVSGLNGLAWLWQPSTWSILGKSADVNDSLLMACLVVRDLTNAAHLYTILFLDIQHNLARLKPAAWTDARYFAKGSYESYQPAYTDIEHSKTLHIAQSAILTA